MTKPVRTAPAYLLAVVVAAMLTACSKKPANLDVEAAVKVFDAKRASFDAWRLSLETSTPGGEQDFRGRTIHDDLEQWVLPVESRSKVEELRARALEAEYLGDAQQLLQTAANQMEEQTRRGKEVWRYWNSELPAPYWRRYWHQVYAANGMPEEPPDSMLVSIEQRITRLLEAGEFKQAATVTDELNDLLGESLNLASGRINSALTTTPAYAPRKTPCPPGSVAPNGDRARIVRGESIEAFYPTDAMNRGEQGSVVLSAQIDPNGCGRSVAIRVHSGVESLDTAALQWFETAVFSPAAVDGRPITGKLSWKIRFVLREAAHPTQK